METIVSQGRDHQLPNEDQTELLRAEAPLEHYDRLYSDDHSGHVTAYDRPYWDSHYYPLYKAALSSAVQIGARKVLEIGCGSGAFAHMLLDRSDLEYHGFDFSAAAIAKAAIRTGRPECFSVERAEAGTTMDPQFDTIVCLEVLEHIERDLDVVRLWRPGANFVCSVPNFDDPAHVRLFTHEDQVRERYGKLLDIRHIQRVPRALVRGRGWLEYGRQLRWSRTDPRKMLGMIGFRTFEYVAGWIVFSGQRRPDVEDRAQP